MRDLSGDHVALGEHVFLDGGLALFVVHKLHGKGLGEPIITCSNSGIKKKTLISVNGSIN